jgi:hypothetical protein
VPDPRTMTKAEMSGILRRVGMTPEVAAQLLEPLPDPVDLGEAGPYLYRNGISLDRLIDRLGGSS